MCVYERFVWAHESIHPLTDLDRPCFKTAGNIPITVLLTFNKLKAITMDPAVVAKALEEGEPSAVVEVRDTASI